SCPDLLSAVPTRRSSDLTNPPARWTWTRRRCCSRSTLSARSMPTKAAGWISTPTATSTSPPATTHCRAAAATAPPTNGRASSTAMRNGRRPTPTTSGKILRVHPEDDGTYTIPEGNLFEPGTDQTRPEIYVMGLRNPYRIHVDPETGWLYWGDVGPDARVDSETRGSKGYDEYNQAREAGFFGWPY